MVERIGKTVLVDASFISSVKIEKLETFLNLFDKSDRSFIVSEEMLRELGDAKKSHERGENRVFEQAQGQSGNGHP